MQNPFLASLRSHTKESHLNLEKLITRKIKNIIHLTDYLHLLRMFYGYYQSLELELDKYLDNNIVPLYSARRKSTVLLKELDYWEENSHDTTPLVCDEIPVIRNVQHALGAMYVLEGSTMGGKIISKLLVQKLNIEAANPFVFFNAYGENTDTMWYSFLSALSEFTEKYEKQQEIINTAIVTFEKFEKWGNNYPDVS